MANPTTNYGFVLPTPTDLVTDLPADFEVALQGVDTQMKTNADAAIAKSIVDAKGDLIAATGADTVSRLAVGTNGQALLANSATATGLEWATPASGSMTLLSTTNLSGAEVTISSISQDYTDLLIIIDNWTIGTGGRLQIGLNGTYGVTSMAQVFASTANGGTSGVFWNSGEVTHASAQLYIRQYKNTSINKPFTGSFARGSSATITTGGIIGGVWVSTSALSSIKIQDNFGNYTMTAGTCRIFGVN